MGLGVLHQGEEGAAVRPGEEGCSRFQGRVNYVLSSESNLNMLHAEPPENIVEGVSV